MNMNKEVKKVLDDSKPECGVKGHRIHVTTYDGNEEWPEWSATVYGTGVGFVHFENDEDGVAWRQNQIEIEKGAAKSEVGNMEEESEVRPGRVVNECGPIGFYSKKVA